MLDHIVGLATPLRKDQYKYLCDINRRQYFPVQTKETRLIRNLLYGFVGLQFVVEKTKKTKPDSQGLHLRYTRKNLTTC